MNVVLEGVRAPTPHFSNCEHVDAIKEHGHGAARSERVAADVGGLVACVEQANCLGSPTHSAVDLVSSDVSECGESWVLVRIDAHVGGATVAEDVVNSAGQCFDGAVCVAGALLVDVLAFDAIFLVF